MNEDSRWHLLPGTLCTTAVFDEFLDHLAVPSENRISVELSQSEIDDYRHYFASNVGDCDVVCGFSLGAIVAAHHADLLVKNATLLLFGLNPMPDDPTKKTGRESLRADVYEFGGRAALKMRLAGQKDRMSAPRFELILTMADAAASLIDAQTQLALSRPGALGALGKAQIPVHAFSGTNDDQVDPAFAQLIARTALFGHCHLLPGLMHYALLEDPEVCARAAADALKFPGQSAEKNRGK